MQFNVILIKNIEYEMTQLKENPSVARWLYRLIKKKKQTLWQGHFTCFSDDEMVGWHH